MGCNSAELLAISSGRRELARYVVVYPNVRSLSGGICVGGATRGFMGNFSGNYNCQHSIGVCCSRLVAPHTASSDVGGDRHWRRVFLYWARTHQ